MRNTRIAALVAVVALSAVAGCTSDKAKCGGGRVPVRVALERTKAFMDQGASGIVYGRNITQHADAIGMTRALMSIVHDGATVDAALAMVKVT